MFLELGQRQRLDIIQKCSAELLIVPHPKTPLSKIDVPCKQILIVRTSHMHVLLYLFRYRTQTQLTKNCPSLWFQTSQRSVVVAAKGEAWPNAFRSKRVLWRSSTGAQSILGRKLKKKKKKKKTLGPVHHMVSDVLPQNKPFESTLDPDFRD